MSKNKLREKHCFRVPASGTLNWADGDAVAKTFDVTILNDSDVETPDETFTVTLSNESVASLGLASATVTITDDGDGWVIRLRIRDSGDAVGWKRFDGFPDYYNAFNYIEHDSVSSDFLYMTDSIDAEVHRFRMDGSGRADLGGFQDPRGVAYDASGDFLYVVDSNGINIDRIVKTKMDGAEQSTYGTSGSGVGNFDRAEGISYDPATGFMYIADRFNHRIVKTKFDGSGWQTLGSQGSGTNQFEFPYGIHYDPGSGFIYIADTGNDRIVKTKIDGTGWQTFGTDGSGEDQFNNPRGIHYDPATDLIYVADTNNERVVRTKIDGSEWRAYRGMSGEEFGSNGVHDVTM